MTYQPSFRQGGRQFRIMNEIMELNRKHRLGLPLIPTVRLRVMENGEKRLILTKLKNVVYLKGYAGDWEFYEDKILQDGSIHSIPVIELKNDSEQISQILETKNRVKRTLKKYGYRLDNIDSWVYTFDSRTGKIKCWIGDFGNITKEDLSTGRQLSNPEIRALEKARKI